MTPPNLRRLTTIVYGYDYTPGEPCRDFDKIYEAMSRNVWFPGSEDVQDPAPLHLMTYVYAVSEIAYSLGVYDKMRHPMQVLLGCPLLRVVGTHGRLLVEHLINGPDGLVLIGSGSDCLQANCLEFELSYLLFDAFGYRVPKGCRRLKFGGWIATLSSRPVIAFAACNALVEYAYETEPVWKKHALKMFYEFCGLLECSGQEIRDHLFKLKDGNP